MNQRIEYLHTKASEIQSGLDLTKVNNKARNAGVRIAWLYEAEDIKMGGKGSIEGGWTEEEIRELSERVEDKKLAGVKGAEGHHQKNAASHPEHQADPKNIKFFRTREQHKEIGHRGDWKNETDDPFIDKDQMLKNTIRRNNIKAELANVKAVVYMAAGTGFLLGAAVTFAFDGVSLKTIQKAIIRGSKQAVKSTVYSLAGYGIGRIAGERLTDAVVKQLVSYGIQFSPPKIALLNQTISGVVVSTLFLSAAYVRLRISGVSAEMAMRQLTPVMGMSIVGLILSSIIGYFFKKPGMFVFSVLWTAGQVWYMKIKDNHRREIIREVEFFRLEHSMPIYVEGTVI